MSARQPLINPADAPYYVGQDVIAKQDIASDGIAGLPALLCKKGDALTVRKVNPPGSPYRLRVASRRVRLDAFAVTAAEVEIPTP